MIPTIAASTGAAFLPSASPAARPSSTTSTRSFTPAPTPSIASRAVPRGVSSGLIGCTSRSLAPSNFLCFCVETTVPMTLPICIDPLSEIPVIDDADDARVDGRLDGIERKARFLAAHEEHFFADAGADRIDGDEGPAGGLALRRERLEDQQLQAHEVFVFSRDDDVPDDSREMHYSLSSISSMMPTMAASTGQSFRPDAMRAELPET